MLPNKREPKPRRVVCAAIRKDGLVICSARHFSGSCREIVKKLGLTFGGWEQGFIDQNDQWLTRAEAMTIARASNQLAEEITEQNPDILMSENLY